MQNCYFTKLNYYFLKIKTIIRKNIKFVNKKFQTINIFYLFPY